MTYLDTDNSNEENVTQYNGGLWKKVLERYQLENSVM